MPPEVNHSTNHDDFNSGVPGLYSSRILGHVAIGPTPAYGVDPGMYDILSSAKIRNCDLSSSIDLDDLLKSKRLSDKEFWRRIYITTPTSTKLTDQSSDLSPKTIHYGTFLQRLGPYTQPLIVFTVSARTRNAPTVQALPQEAGILLEDHQGAL